MCCAVFSNDSPLKEPSWVFIPPSLVRILLQGLPLLQGVPKVRAFNPSPCPAPRMGWGEYKKTRICELCSQILVFLFFPSARVWQMGIRNFDFKNTVTTAETLVWRAIGKDFFNYALSDTALAALKLSLLTSSAIGVAMR